MQSITDLIERKHGSRNWVLARRTARIVERYGADVVTLSQAKYRALEIELENENATQHPAAPVLAAAMTANATPADVIRSLLAAGFKIEKDYRVR